MEDNTKRRPFYKIFIGVISALMAIGGLFGVLGSIMLPDDSFLGDSFLGYLFVCVIFTIMAVYFLKPEKTEREKDNERKSKKLFVSFLRVVIFIAVWIIMCIIGKLCYPSPISPKGETHLNSINTTSLFGSDDFNNWLKDSTNIKLVNSAASEWDDLTQDELEGLKRHLYINSRIKQDLGEDVYDSMPDTLRLREKVDYYNSNLPIAGIRLNDLYNSDDYKSWVNDPTNIKLIETETSEYGFDLNQTQRDRIKQHLYLNSRIKQDLGEDVYNSMPDTLGVREKIDYYNSNLPIAGIRREDLYGSDDYNNWLKDSTNIKLVKIVASEYGNLNQDELDILQRQLYLNSRIKQDLGEDVYDSMPDTLGVQEKINYYNNHLPKDSIKQTGSSLGYIVFSLLGIILGIVVAYFCPLPTKRRGVVKSPESGSVAIKDKSINPNRTIRFLRWLVSRCPKWVIVAYLVLVWINIGLLIGSFQARSWRGYFYVPFNSYSSDEIVSLHDWEKPQNIIFPFPSRYSASDGACTGIGRTSAWDIKTYDWTEFLAYLIIPFLCIVTCILVLERTDKLKDAPPDDSTQKENEEI